ncbi:MAG TPA: hypothetical protein VMW42_11135, partial [Desulfatiglandales bacterium]|nr:hypothetical protein [Desulfatiglandales bacterium]
MPIKRFLLPAIVLSILISFFVCFTQISFSEGGSENEVNDEGTPRFVQDQAKEYKPIFIRLGRTP